MYLFCEHTYGLTVEKWWIYFVLALFFPGCFHKEIVRWNCSTLTDIFLKEFVADSVFSLLISHFIKQPSKKLVKVTDQTVFGFEVLVKTFRTVNKPSVCAKIKTHRNCYFKKLGYRHGNGENHQPQRVRPTPENLDGSMHFTIRCGPVKDLRKDLSRGRAVKCEDICAAENLSKPEKTSFSVCRSSNNGHNRSFFDSLRISWSHAKVMRQSWILLALMPLFPQSLMSGTETELKRNSGMWNITEKLIVEVRSEAMIVWINEKVQTELRTKQRLDKDCTRKRVEFQWLSVDRTHCTNSVLVGGSRKGFAELYNNL